MTGCHGPSSCDDPCPSCAVVAPLLWQAAPHQQLPLELWTCLPHMEHCCWWRMLQVPHWLLQHLLLLLLLLDPGHPPEWLLLLLLLLAVVRLVSFHQPLHQWRLQVPRCCLPQLTLLLFHLLLLQQVLLLLLLLLLLLPLLPASRRARYAR